jgi:hypothetical protein
MDYGLFEEALVDLFCRQHHDVAVARSRAAAIIRIAKGCDEEIVGGDRGMEIVCPTTTPFAECIEAATAIMTLDAFLAEREQKKEPPKRLPYEIRLPFGRVAPGSPPGARGPTPRGVPVEPAEGGRAAEAPAPEIEVEGTAGAVSGATRRRSLFSGRASTNSKAVSS